MRLWKGKNVSEDPFYFFISFFFLSSLTHKRSLKLRFLKKKKCETGGPEETGWDQEKEKTNEKKIDKLKNMKNENIKKLKKKEENLKKNSKIKNDKKMEKMKKENGEQNGREPHTDICNCGDHGKLMVVFSPVLLKTLVKSILQMSTWDVIRYSFEWNVGT